MWKDFFYFSKGERLAIVTLTIIILLVQIILWTSDYWMPFLPEELTKEKARRKELQAFQDSFSQKSGGRSVGYSGKKYTGYHSQSVRLTDFNPNTADSVTFVRLGLRPYVAKNILKYRRKGGVFHKPEDFGRIYGIESKQFETLKPYIKLGTEGGSEKKYANSYDDASATTPASSSKLSSDKAASSAQGSTGYNGMELNTADTSILQQLKGVGSATAGRIARYRNQLGGFYSMKQLGEVKGLYPETLARLQSMLQIDPSKINRINANNASLEKLRAHPYLSFYQAKVIVELRKARKGIRSIDELADFKEFTADDLERLKWYLVF
jgi:DNA uptake protein ComE-like DNA-binding protein